ncbi:hypothetical protein LZ30DRAFT_378842 [Colletotrichum cereale]|nr:hypothetical protein LZ30DRAFT_378842 [Colletotrichum cereale]
MILLSEWNKKEGYCHGRQRPICSLPGTRVIRPAAGQLMFRHHVLTFLLCNSDEEGDSTKRKSISRRKHLHQETSSAPSTASPDLAAEIKTACSAAARHHEPAKRSEVTPSSRSAHVYVQASMERSLHLRTTSSDGKIITHSFVWNTSGSDTDSTECDIPRPDSPTI